MELEKQYQNFVRLYRIPTNLRREEARLILENMAKQLVELSERQQSEFLAEKAEVLCRKTFSGHYLAIVDFFDYLYQFSVFGSNAIGDVCKDVFSRILDASTQMKIEQLIVHCLDPSWEGGDFADIPNDGSVWL